MRVDEARWVLDRFQVAERLQHIRRFVWRGGSLRYCAHGNWIYYEVCAADQALRIGIDLASPAVIFIRGAGVNSLVPYVGRARDDVEHALQSELCARVL
jgi:hypothetical protein